MRIITQLGLALGLLLLISLLIWQGVLDVIKLLIESGWNLLWLPLIWLPNFLPATEGWRLVFSNNQKPSFYHALLAMWMGRAVNNMLPVASIGGEIVKARLVNFWGIPGINAAASVMVDKVAQAMSVAAWGLIGVCLLVYLTADQKLALYAFAGFMLLAMCAIGFLYVQKKGLLGSLATLGGKLIKTDSWEGITFSAREIDAVIHDTYHHKARFFLAVTLRTLGLIIQTTEVWLACILFGHPIGLLEAIMLKSLTTTLSDVAFIIPNAYGIQEGAFIMVGALVGLPPDVALAISLAIRIRDVLLDPAGLLTLHQIEAKEFFRKKDLRKPGNTDQDVVTD